MRCKLKCTSIPIQDIRKSAKIFVHLFFHLKNQRGKIISQELSLFGAVLINRLTQRNRIRDHSRVQVRVLNRIRVADEPQRPTLAAGAAGSTSRRTFYFVAAGDGHDILATFLPTVFGSASSPTKCSCQS